MLALADPRLAAVVAAAGEVPLVGTVAAGSATEAVATDDRLAFNEMFCAPVPPFDVKAMEKP